MTRVSILAPYDPMKPQLLAPFAELVRSSSLHALWQGTSLVGDTTSNATYLAGRGFDIPYGFGVRLTGLSHPHAAAQQAAMLARTTGQPVVAGFGPGGISAQESLHGRRLPSVLGHMRDYVYGARRALATSPEADVSIGFGVLRPRMAELCGEVADVAITWMTPPSYIRDVIAPAIRRGAEKSGREPARIVSIVPFGFGDDDQLVDLARHSVGVHLSLEHYRDALRRAGGTPPSENGVDQASARGLVDTGVLYPAGAADVIRARQFYAEAGAAEVVVNVMGAAQLAGPRRTLAALIDIAEALGADETVSYPRAKPAQTANDFRRPAPTGKR